MKLNSNTKPLRPGQHQVNNIDLAIDIYKRLQAKLNHRNPHFIFSETDKLPRFAHDLEASLCAEYDGIVILRDKGGRCIGGYVPHLQNFLPAAWVAKQRISEARYFNTKPK